MQRVGEVLGEDTIGEHGKGRCCSTGRKESDGERKEQDGGVERTAEVK